MDNKYLVLVTSKDSATVNDVPLTPPDDIAMTRRIIRPTLVNNVHEAAASVQIKLIHQKRHKKNEPWQDEPSFKMSTMKAGEQVVFNLGATETFRLASTLNQLYTLCKNGVPRETEEYEVHDAQSILMKGEDRQVLEQMLAEHGESFWQILSELNPTLLQTLALKKLHDKRQQEINQFKALLSNEKTSENDWQKFFSKNKWIFGYGLMYQILGEIQEQPHYGGGTVNGTGEQRGDFLLATQADARFVVLVEIKKPHTNIFDIPSSTGREKYRNKVYEISSEVVGGVSQVQSNCRTWVVDGSRQEGNAELLREARAFTYEPKGILVLGHTNQLDNFDKKATFELFRRNIHNPEIITYDELLARAEFIVSQDDNL